MDPGSGPAGEQHPLEGDGLFQALLDAAPDAMVIVGEDGKILLANVQAVKLFGHRQEEMLGQPIELLVPERFRGSHPRHRASYSHDPKARPMGTGMELYARRKDGGEFLAEISLGPLATAKGLLISAAVRDISPRKRMEQELRQANEELQDQNRRVETANRMKSQFLANMSHELRTPLNSIIGFSEMIHDGKAGPLNPDQKEYLGDVLTSSRHLLQLINDVLDLAKVEAGKVTLTLGVVDLEPLLRQTVGMLRVQAESKGLSLHVEASVPGSVQGDAGRLKQVLFNYLSNAIKFSKPGGEVWVRALSQGPERYRLEVEDQGIGIAPEDQPRLFGEFEQLDAGTDKRYQGTGLGLSLTKRMVELMGGQVGVESRLGQGSRFYAVLPNGSPQSA